MKLQNEFTIPLTPEAAWDQLLDIENVAPCLPGAEITEKVDESTFKGHIAVKLGPVALKFRGTAQIADTDSDSLTSRLVAKGTDAKGRGAVDATIDFQLVPADHDTRVLVATDIRLTGNVAQYGRATGIIEGLANQLITDFAVCLRARMERAASAGDGGAGPVAEGTDPSPIPRRASIGPGYIVSLLWSALVRWLRGLTRRSR